MEITQFKNFKELASASTSENEYTEVKEIIDEIYNTSLKNEEWIGKILEFLNNNQEGKYYSEYYLNPHFSDGTRKYTYRFISTEEDMSTSITDSDIEVLKRLNAQTKFILYDYQEEPSEDTFAYLEETKTLKQCLEAIGIPEDLKEHLCEYCFNIVRLNKKRIIEQRNTLSKENIKSLFKNHDLEHILKLIKENKQKLDFDILNLIVIEAQKILSHPNANIWDKEKLKKIIMNSNTQPGFLNQMSYDELVNFHNRNLVEACEDILIEIIYISIENQECFGPILEQLCKNENDTIRLHCCANSDYTIFLNDPSPRVLKVANIRYEFDKKWEKLNDDNNEKQRINFLISAIQKGLIGIIVNSVLYLDAKDKTDIELYGMIFQNRIVQRRFDTDILYTIKDRRILADTINEIIKQGEIVLNYNIVPNCFQTINETSQQESSKGPTKKLIPPKSTDN